VTIPSGVLRIGDNAFENCEKLTAVRIPPSVVQIGNSAFEGCGPEFRILALEGSCAAVYAAGNGIPWGGEQP
jgi:hypothetical protein